MKLKHQTYIAALRSGKYIQFRGKLHNSDKTAFCCIGVMAKIDNYVGSGLTGSAAIALGFNNDLVSPKGGKYLVSQGIAPHDIFLLTPTLIALNDTYRWDFNAIADFLEVQWDSDQDPTYPLNEASFGG